MVSPLRGPLSLLAILRPIDAGWFARWNVSLLCQRRLTMDMEIFSPLFMLAAVIGIVCIGLGFILAR